MDEFHFLRPLWLLVIPAWLGLVIGVQRAARGDSAWQRVCDPQLAPYVVEGGAAARSRLFQWLAAVAGVLALLALAGPAWRELPQPVYRGQSALVVVLDVSRSMNAADIRPSRLVRARHKIRDLLAQRRDGQTALVAYAGDAFVVTPLTDDTRTIRALLASLEPDIMPAPGSRPDRAIERAAELLRQAGALRGRVLLITDSADGAALDDAADALWDEGYTLSVIGMGTPEGAPIPGDDGFVTDETGDIVVARLDEPALAALAERAGGAYARYRLDDGDLSQVLPAGQGAAGTEQDGGLRTDLWREEGPWLLLVVLVLVLPFFRRERTQ